MTDLADFPKIISVDDHVVEPADVWQDRLPEKYKDAGPTDRHRPAGRHEPGRRRLGRDPRRAATRWRPGGTTKTTATRSRR